METQMFAVDIARAAGDPRWRRSNNSVAYVQDIPRTRVNIHTVDTQRCRILSYRWDFSSSNCSKNILVAIEYCIKKKLDYLFLDVVSVDQSLPRDQLIQRVAGLKSLYSTMPVIAAYDNETDDYLVHTIRRPWITSEVLAYAQNPLGVEYLSFMQQQGCGRIETITGTPYITDTFDDLLKSSISAGLANSAMLLLSGVTKNFNVSDFGLICPPLADVVDSDLIGLSEGDRLLLIAMLLFAQKPISGRAGRISYSIPERTEPVILEMRGANIDNHVCVKPALLSLVQIEEGPPYSITFQGQLLGHLRTKPSYREFTSIASHENRLLLKDNACRLIFELLGVPSKTTSLRLASLSNWTLSAELTVPTASFFWNQNTFEEGNSVASRELEQALDTK